jgi:hypothetical protein
VLVDVGVPFDPDNNGASQDGVLIMYTFNDSFPGGSDGVATIPGLSLSSPTTPAADTASRL